MKRLVQLSGIAIIWCLIAATMAFGQSSKDLKFSKKTMFQDEEIVGIEVGGSYEIMVMRGESTYVKLEYPTKDERYLRVSLRNGILKLDSKSRKSDEENGNISHPKIKAVVCLSDLTTIDVSGVAEFQFIGEYSPKSLIINIYGVANLSDLECSTDDIVMQFEGVTSLKDMRLKCKNWGFDNKGVMTISDVQVEANRATIESNGTLNSDNFSVNTDHLHMDIDGVTSFDISGNARRAAVSVSGMAKVNGKSLSIDDLNVSTDGMASATFQVEETLSCNVADLSKLHIFGHPKIVDEYCEITARFSKN